MSGRSLICEICSGFGAPESSCFQNLPSPQHNLACQRGQVFLQLTFDGLSGVVGTAVVRPYSAGWISRLIPCPMPDART
jgi:hypothetical protein